MLTLGTGEPRRNGEKEEGTCRGDFSHREEASCIGLGKGPSLTARQGRKERSLHHFQPGKRGKSPKQEERTGRAVEDKPEGAGVRSV